MTELTDDGLHLKEDGDKNLVTHTQEDVTKPIGEYVVQHLKEYEVKKNLISVAKESLEHHEEAFLQHYDLFSQIIKIGILNDATNRKKLASLLRYYTSTSSDERCSLIVVHS